MDTVTEPRTRTSTAAHRSGKRPWWARLGLWLAMIAALTVALVLTTSVPVLTIVGALVLGSLIIWTGYAFLRQLATPPPPPPDPGELRKVRLTYRCSVCGTEVKMTAANDEDPEPPRHCMEDMELVAPLYD